MNKKKARFLGILLLASGLPLLYGEQIRGTLMSDTVLSFDTVEGTAFSLSIEGIGAVRVGSPFDTLLEAIEIEVRIPREAEKYMDGFACLVYSHVTPGPSEDIHNYRGTQLGYTSLPARGRLYIRIPVTGGGDSPTGPGTVVFNRPEGPASFPLFITLLPFMKGIPDTVYELAFPVKVRPLLKDQGLLDLDIRSSDGQVPESLKIFIDDKAVDISDGTLTLSPGLHTLLAEADGHLPADRTFSVEKGGVARISLTMERDIPRVLIEAPRGSSVFLDGEQLTPPFQEHLEISEGEHTVLYTIGDYTISRKFHAEAGGNYKIALFLDILIENY